MNILKVEVHPPVQQGNGLSKVLGNR